MKEDIVLGKKFSGIDYKRKRLRNNGPLLD
jgi:hypothetical protein